MIYSVNPLIL